MRNSTKPNRKGLGQLTFQNRTVTMRWCHMTRHLTHAWRSMMKTRYAICQTRARHSRADFITWEMVSGLSAIAVGCVVSMRDLWCCVNGAKAVAAKTLISVGGVAAVVFSLNGCNSEMPVRKQFELMAPIQLQAPSDPRDADDGCDEESTDTEDALVRKHQCND